MGAKTVSGLVTIARAAYVYQLCAVEYRALQEHVHQLRLLLLSQPVVHCLPPFLAALVQGRRAGRWLRGQGPRGVCGRYHLMRTGGQVYVSLVLGVLLRRMWLQPRVGRQRRSRYAFWARARVGVVTVE